MIDNNVYFIFTKSSLTISNKIVILFFLLHLKFFSYKKPCVRACHTFFVPRHIKQVETVDIPFKRTDNLTQNLNSCVRTSRSCHISSARATWMLSNPQCLISEYVLMVNIFDNGYHHVKTLWNSYTCFSHFIS